MSIVNVREFVEKKKERLKRRVRELRDKGIIPKLAVILANDVEASRIYIAQKRKLCYEMGIEEKEYFFDSKSKTEELISVIGKLNEDKEVTGILVQLPVFKHLDEKQILDSIDPKKDVDGFTSINVGKLYLGRPDNIPCTPKGVLSIIKELEPEIEGKNAVVIGRSQIVGKPMAAILLNEGATVTICHSKTKDLSLYTKTADILIVATGVPHLVTKDMVKEGTIVIDVGMTRIDDKWVGDVDTQSVEKVAKYITPVPGGAGLTTVYSLLENIVEISEKQVK